MMFLGTAPAGGRTQLQCTDVIEGRYVVMYLNHTSVLNMCEVQVFGSKYALLSIWVQINISLKLSQKSIGV